MPKIEALALLADGQFHSGQELADVLGVSRTAVWKQIGRLQALGLEVESVRGRGYRLPGGIELLDEALIQELLEPTAKSLLRELTIFPEIDSTNAELLRRLQNGPGRGLVCTAEQQTAGRGRRGRHWVSPFASNIYLSLAWEFAGGAAALEGLSLATGVAVTRALEQCGVTGVAVKWPNDVLYEGAKLAGVLIEMIGEPSGSCQVVLGVGLNVRMPAVAASAIDQKWTDLDRVSNGGLNRNLVLSALLNQLLPMLNEYEQAGFAQWREAWMALNAHANCDVIVTSGDRKVAGVARGIDASGALLLETAAGVQAIHGGEVSLRAAS